MALGSDLLDVFCRCIITVSELEGNPSPSFSPLALPVLIPERTWSQPREDALFSRPNPRLQHHACGHECPSAVFYYGPTTYKEERATGVVLNPSH